MSDSVPPGSDPPKETAQQVMGKTRMGVIWSVATGLFTRAIGLITTLLLTYYMSPQQSGSVNVALNLVMMMTTITTVGVGQFIASQKHPEPRMAWNATLIHVSLGVITLLGTLLAAEPLVRRFGAPDGARYVPLLVLTFLLERLVYVPERVLIGHMRFRQLGYLRSGGELIYCGGALAGAVLGLGPWCIVSGNLARQVGRILIVLRYVPFSEWVLVEGPNREAVERLLRFGLPTMVAAVCSFFSRRFDNLLVSRYYGPDVLGLYNLAYNLADVPAAQLADLVTDSLAPSFARLDRPERIKALTDITAALCFTVFPLAVGLGLCAPTLAQIFPSRWRGVSTYLAVLSVLSLTRPFAMAAAVYMQALRRTSITAVLYVTQMATLLGALVLVGKLFPDHPVFACYAVGVNFFVLTVASVWALHSVDRVPAWPILRAHLVPVPGLLVMALAVLGTRRLLGPMGVGVWPLLILQVVMGGLAYAIGALVLTPGPTYRLVGAVRSLRRQR